MFNKQNIIINNINPKVSVIIPLYNSEKHITQCLESVMNQSYRNIEIIIVNDGSTDSSLKFLTNFNNRGGVRIITQNNKGAAAARNAGLNIATGDYIQFLDADDILASNKIESQINYYKDNNWTQETLTFCKWTKLEIDISLMNNNHKSVWHNYDNPIDILNDFIINGCFLPLHAYLTPIKLINEAGKWNETLSKNDDGEFFARILSKATSLHYCDDGVAYYRSTPNSLSKRMSHKAAMSQIESQILMAEIMRTNPNPRTNKAIYKMINDSLRSFYPYYKYQRQIGEKYLNSMNLMAEYPSLNYKEWIYYLLHPSLH